MKEKQAKQHQQEQQQQNQHQTATTKPTKLRPKIRTQQKLRFNYEARNSATGSQRVQQQKKLNYGRKIKSSQLWLHSRQKKKGNFTKERKEKKKNKQTNYSPTTSYNSYYNFNMSHTFSSSTSSFLLPSSQTKPKKKKYI